MRVTRLTTYLIINEANRICSTNTRHGSEAFATVWAEPGCLYGGVNIAVLAVSGGVLQQHHHAKFIVVTTILVVSCKMITRNKYKEDTNNLW